MTRNFPKALVAGLFLTAGSVAHAGTIDPNSTLLDEAGATLLEGWLGQGDLDWTSVWYGGVGATAESWHGAVDTLTHTVSIYRAINSLGDEVLVGGYAVNDWSGAGPYKSDYTYGSFIFNLTQIEHQALHRPNYGQFIGARYFAAFGAIDLYGSQDTIGTEAGHIQDGFTESNAYDNDKGTIDVGNGDNINYNRDQDFRVLALETFTFVVAAAPEPEPEPEAESGEGSGSGLIIESDSVPQGESSKNTVRFVYK